MSSTDPPSASPENSSLAALHEAAKAAGGQSALALALGFRSRRNIWPYFKLGRRFPAELCPDVELLYGVRCERLRPDVKWHVLRGSSSFTPHPSANTGAQEQQHAA